LYWKYNRVLFFHTFVNIKINERINYIIDEIADQYSIDDNNKPWVIGFSGGKDSTVLLTLTWLALLKIKKEKLE